MAAIVGNKSPQVYARTAGVLYLLIVVLGIWSEVFVRAALVAPGDAAATAANIAANEGMFRLSFAADSIMALSDVGVAVLLYVLLSPVSRTLALVAAALRLLQTAVIAVNLLYHYTALLLLNGAEYAVFAPDQLNALVALVLDMHSHGYDLGLIFFGMSCIVLGYLIAVSGYFPRLLGYFVTAAGVSYLIGSYTLFLLPAYAEPVGVIYVVPLVSELSLGLWLLLRGVNVDRWERAERAAAVPA